MNTILKLLFLVALTTSVSFAQDDGYHQKEKQTCISETCIIVGGSEIGYIEYTDLEGNKIKSLNTNSSILDMDLSVNNTCFTGSNKDVEKMLEQLAGNTNAYYTSGGHAFVENIAYAQSSPTIVVAKIFYRSDYSSSVEVDYAVIKKCE
jgi:hypothetical protein